jgi:K+-sensing histidine kinase KdpD
LLVVAEETTARVVATCRAKALADIASDLADQGGLQLLLERAATKARDELRAHGAVLLLADSDARFRGAVELGDGRRVDVAARAADLPSGGDAIRRREPVPFRRATAGGLEATWLRTGGAERGLCAPIPGAGGSLGLLYFTWIDDAPVTPADLSFAAVVASACALAVQRARVVRREREARHASRRATQRLELLAESGALLSGAVDWPTVVRTTAQLGLGYLADIAALDLVAADGLLYREAMEFAGDPPALRPPAAARHEVQSPVLREVLATRRPRRIVLAQRAEPDDGVDPDLTVLEALGATSCIAAPLVLRGHAAGVLTLLRRAPSPPHEAEDVALATEIARRAAIAFDDARLLAAAADESAARDAFLAAAGHDIRSPLTALRLQVRAIERSASVGERARPWVARLVTTVDRLARRVDQVLEAARLGPRGTPLAREPLDLAQLTREAVAGATRERSPREPPVAVIAPAPVPGLWDRSRVEGIVTNLLAVAMKRGGTTLEVRVTQEPRGGRIEVLRPGVPDAPLHHAETAAAHEHLEVGVWIAQRFAESHGGQLRTARLPNGGARFTVDLRG